MAKKMFDIGVVVGRFQVSALTAGHSGLIRFAIDKSKMVVVLLGISPTPPTRRNPLDYNTRRVMLESQFPGILVLPLHDHVSDYEWSRNLDHMVRGIKPTGSVGLFGGRDSFAPHYYGAFPIHEHDPENYESGTMLRDSVAHTVPDSAEFRQGAIYTCYSRFPAVYPTVDMLVTRPASHGGHEIVLCAKSAYPGKVLPGGFVDPADTSFEHAARREVQEELGIDVADPVYLLTQPIDDWRYRGTSDKIITTLFHAPYLSGALRPADDIIGAQWVCIDHGIASLMAKNHADLLLAGLTKLKAKGVL